MDPIELLRDLVAIPSVNPMGREDLDGPEFYEGRMTAYLLEFFQRLGVAYEHIEVAPGRCNVLARIDCGATTTVLMDAHQDTVPTDGMTIPPFEPVVENGRLYGRGACDVKGGMAAMLTAFARLAQHKDGLTANVVMSCTCDEESSSLGIDDLTRLWTDPARAGSLLTEKPTAAVVAEPTELHVVVAHRGASRWKIKTAGRACHSSRPSDGVNAIYRMASVLQQLQQYAELLGTLVAPHPLCGPATLSVGRIEGGTSVNTVPDWCTIELDRRCIPGEDGMAVIEDVRQFLASKLEFEVEFLPPFLMGPPLPDSDNGTWADRLLQHIGSVAPSREKIGVPYGTHASRTALAGVPSVVFGPGSIQQAHTKDEWIETEQLLQAAEVYYQFCRSAGA